MRIKKYVRELIDRIDEMSLRGAKLCVRCTETHPGEWEGKLGKAQCARTAGGRLSDILFCSKVRLWRGGRAVVSSNAYVLQHIVTHLGIAPSTMDRRKQGLAGLGPAQHD